MASPLCRPHAGPSTPGQAFGQEDAVSRDILRQILDLARWAPSGDNTQPWRFEIIDDTHLRVFGHDTRDHILYDYEGHASHIAHGALLETIRIAATGFGLQTGWQIQSAGDHRNPVYKLSFAADPTVRKDVLFDHIKTRVVQRRPMRTTRLTAAQREALVVAAGPDYRVQLFEPFAARRAMAGMLWNSAYIRLTCPEAYPVHRDIIEWNAQFSKDRIPDQAVGVDPATAKLMRWVMHSWERVHFFNRFLGGTIAPRLQLDFLPALLCAAHVLVRPKAHPESLDDWIRMGLAWQRMWLTTTQQGLHFQPEMTPVIFRWYARSGKRFSRTESLYGNALALSAQFESIAEAKADDPFGFMFRVGTSPVPRSRSIRLDMPDLMAGGA